MNRQAHTSALAALRAKGTRRMVKSRAFAQSVGLAAGSMRSQARFHEDDGMNIREPDGGHDPATQRPSAAMLNIATVSAADFLAGNLPRTSPFSGIAGGDAVTIKYRTAPRWTIALILVGILLCVGWIPGALIRLALSKTAKGVIYVTRPERTRMRAQRLLPWAALLVAIALFVVAGFPGTPAPGLWVLAALGLFGAFILSLMFGVPRPGPKAAVSEPTPGGKIVTFYGVHPAFAAAVLSPDSQSAHSSRRVPQG